MKVVFVILMIFFVIGCGSNVNVKVNSPPNGAIDSPASENIIIVGRAVSFSGSGTDPDSGTSLTYLWDFGGGAPSSTEKDPGSVIFNTPGTYTVTLIVTDELGISDPTPATVSVKVVYLFAASDELHGTELWATDGTGAGTGIIKDINPGIENSYPWSSYPSDFVYINGTVFFFAGDEAHGMELWKSDGTKSGTVTVKDINPSWYSSIDTQYHHPATKLIAINDTLFFFATDGIHGTELWRSDGRKQGPF